MLPLDELQKQMTTAVRGGDTSRLIDELVAMGANPMPRLQIYHNNSFISITEALKATFPVTVRLVDERFFAYAANAFIHEKPPNEPRLARYGRGFPGFLRRFEPCRPFPYIADVAYLEWIIADCLQSPELMAVSLQAASILSGAGPIALELQPSLRFVISRWPIFEIWKAHQAEGATLPNLSQRRPARIMVHRYADSVRFLTPQPVSFRFSRDLALGHSLEAAAARALKRDPLFDITRELLGLFRAGLIVGISSQIPSHSSKE